jgi:signal transduction histidine kinase
MIGSISHGMKGLLTSLDGGLYIVDSGLKHQDMERAAQGCDAARKTAEQIRKMVLDILYYAKDRELKRAPVDVREFAGELVRVVRPRVEAGDIRLRCRFDENLGMMSVDADDLQAALINILDNAVDACLKNRAAGEHRIDFSVSGDGEKILFRIADNGVGMDEETRESVFDLFYSTKGKKGTGLGLFIANRVVGQHEGAITVSSTVGKGTEFRVAIPVSPAAQG